MKRYAFLGLMMFVFLSLAGAATVAGNVLLIESDDMVAQVKIEEARKTALKSVEGTILEEFTIEDEENKKIFSYVFVIKRKDAKVFDVEIDATNGKVVGVTEQTEAEDEEDDPSSAEDSFDQ